MPSRSIAMMKEAGWIELRNVIAEPVRVQKLELRDYYVEAARNVIAHDWRAARDFLRLASDAEGEAKRMKWCLTAAGRAIAEGGKP